MNNKGKRIKTHRKSKKKTKRQKKTIKNRNEARKYIEIMNAAYKQITSSWHDIFDKDDYLLLSYIKQGIKKGWNILKDKNIIKEIKCNSLCMTMSILNSTLGRKKRLDQLNPVQELYLFFISYLIDDSNLLPKEASLKHAIKKIDNRIMMKRKQLLRYEAKKDNRNIKKCHKYIERQESTKKQLIESDGINKEGIGHLFKIDVCDSIDCQYLQEYKMDKSQKWNETYSKFCLNITEIFKGIVWLNMFMIFNRTESLKVIKGMSPYMKQIDVNVDIRKAIYRQDIILIPDSYIYESDIFYKDNTLDRARKKAVIRSKDKKYWMYHKLNLEKGTIDKRGIDTLESKHYVAAMLHIPYESDWRSPREVKEKEMWKNFQDFLNGEGKMPKLKKVYKTVRNIGENERHDLQEDIENTITLHWIYIHRDRLDDFIDGYME